MGGRGVHLTGTSHCCILNSQPFYAIHNAKSQRNYNRKDKEKVRVLKSCVKACLKSCVKS